MSSASVVTRLLGRSPLIAVVLYIAVVGSFVAMACVAVFNVLDQMHALAQTSDMLDQLRSRQARATAGALSATANLPGTPFLEGSTVTVAGAALLQRVSSAVSVVGGTIQSSQLDVATQAKEGFVALQMNCEMEQPALQKLLYDLEEGMPFLFVDQLDVQVPQTNAQSETSTGRIKVVLGVSGQWQGGK
jgi:general secretion pathway protein M